MHWLAVDVDFHGMAHAIPWKSEGEEENRDEDEHREQYRNAVPDDIAEEGGHLDAHLFGDGLDHEVWAIADVCHRAHEDGAERDEGEPRLVDPVAAEQFYGAFGLHRRACFGEMEEDEVGRRIVEHATEAAGDPEVHPRLGEHGRHLFTLRLEYGEGNLHGDEDADEQGRDFDDGPVIKVIRLTDVPCRRDQ